MREERGFTLIEVLLASAFFIGLSLLFFATFSTSAIYQEKSARLTKEVNWAEEAMEEMKSKDWSFFALPDRKENIQLPEVEKAYQVVAYISSLADEDLKKVDIVVFHNGKMDFSLTSIVAHHCWDER